MIGKWRKQVPCWFLQGLAIGCALGHPVATAQVPNHPIITEVYSNPIGPTDGPVARDSGSLHQEFIELYLPTGISLDPALNKDAIRLAFYEVEGDKSSSGVELINYRFDLPTFDLDASNGITPGAIARPSSGIVVLGWVDYIGDPPFELAGTPSSRIGLIDGGLTLPPIDFEFIPINGAHFSGTTNFVSVVAESLIDLPGEATSGIVQNGSGAYLLVNRDSPGYVELCDDKHSLDCVDGVAPQLPDDFLGLTTTALLDGFAANDDTRFRVDRQPFDSGDNVDLATVLPIGGAFSLLIPQVPETSGVQPAPGIADGYARVFVDSAKTTENLTSFDDDPIVDALTAYRHTRNVGPFFATPGRAASTSSVAEMSVAMASEQAFDVLAGTTGGPGVLCANVGGNFAIDMAVAPGTSSAPLIATFATGPDDIGVMGQSLGFPRLAVSTGISAVHGATASAAVTVTGTNTNLLDPAIVAPIQATTVTATVLNPTTGTDQNGLSLQATVFAAIQGILPQVGVANEFLTTDLGAYAAANLGTLVQAGRGHGAILADPTTNLGDGLFVQLALVEDFPDPLLPATFINAPAPPVIGKLDLVQTVLQSAEVLSGVGTYDEAINLTATGLRAVRLNHPDTLTFGGSFTPSELIHFVPSTGRPSNPRSGLTNATTTRTFELAIIDSNVRDNGSFESGSTDDFGIILEVQDTEPGSPVVDGEYIFLSFTGGVQGTDIDSLQTPLGPNIATIIYLDLDNLHDVLGVRSIEQVFVIDAGGTGEVDVIEVYSLNPVNLFPCLVDADCDDGNPCTVDTCPLGGSCLFSTAPDGTACADALFCNGAETCTSGVCVPGTAPCSSTCEQCDELSDTCSHCPFDLDFDAFGVIGTGDFGLFSGCFGRSYLPVDPMYVSCQAANFDGVIDSMTGEYVVGTGDFGVFSGCFGGTCDQCVTCFP